MMCRDLLFAVTIDREVGIKVTGTMLSLFNKFHKEGAAQVTTHIRNTFRLADFSRLVFAPNQYLCTLLSGCQVPVLLILLQDPYVHPPLCHTTIPLKDTFLAHRSTLHCISNLRPLILWPQNFFSFPLPVIPGPRVRDLLIFINRKKYVFCNSIYLELLTL